MSDEITNTERKNRKREKENSHPFIPIPNAVEWRMFSIFFLFFGNKRNEFYVQVLRSLYCDSKVRQRNRFQLFILLFFSVSYNYWVHCWNVDCAHRSRFGFFFSLFYFQLMRMIEFSFLIGLNEFISDWILLISKRQRDYFSFRPIIPFGRA